MAGKQFTRPYGMEQRARLVANLVRRGLLEDAMHLCQDLWVELKHVVEADPMIGRESYNQPLDVLGLDDSPTDL
jgi:hypothetical protein